MTAVGDVAALTVHGPAGIVDLTVPTDATMLEVAQEYAAQARVPRVLPLVTRTGHALPAGSTLGECRLASGALVVAVDPAAAPVRSRRRSSMMTGAAPADPGPLSAMWCGLAAAAAALAAWSATAQPAGDRVVVVVVLAAAAVLGCLPVGPLAGHRVVTAPAFAAAACFAHLWDPAPERLPTIVGAAALAAAVAAAVGRALQDQAEEALRVWMVVGAGWFVVAALAALLSAEPQVVWSLLLVAAVLGARFVPGVAVDVPDDYLLDLERLAVTAWSARERPSGRRGRIVVPEATVADVAARGARMITAAAGAIAVVTAVSAPLLLRSADLDPDRIGARCVVGFGGCALLLAARSYRHTVARRLLRVAGVWCLAALAAALLPVLGDAPLGFLAGTAIGVGLLLVLVAVAVGRGWRSTWWSRRAEVAEVVCGSFALGAVVVSVGLFRHLWTLTS